MPYMSKISVIVPVYNVESYLKRCIDSIINQSYRNLEIILVNDGSPDNCGTICDEYTKQDQRIKVIHKTNGGLSDARNAGIALATGDYIGFVDSDDYVHPQMYEILYKNLIQTNADISICRFDRIDENHPILTEREDIITELSQTEALSRLFTYSCLDFTIAWNKLYRRELFNKIRYPKGRIREDEFTTYKLIYLSKKIVLTEQSLYYYVQSPNSIMRNSDLKKEIDYADAMEERIAFLKLHNLTDFYISALKRYCIWLIALYHKKKSFLNKNIHIESDFKQRIRHHIDLLQKECSIPFISWFIYNIAKMEPSIIGLLATQKLYSHNLAASLMDWFFDERNRFAYHPNKCITHHTFHTNE